MMRRGLIGPLVIALLCAGALSGQVTQAGAADRAAPLYAYYYIWFNPSSWNRAKSDYPLLGRYSSDERTIIRRHVRWAKSAGVGGFIVSWKSTPTLDSRLAKLISVAEEESFALTIIYQGLDFERRPLPTTRIASDLDRFVRRWGDSPAFGGFGRPVVIWSGTWKFDRDEIAEVTSGRRDSLRILATERNPRDYAAKADLFDGDAYYWSSANPETYPRYAEKLKKMGSEVHRTGGLWFAPLAPGFDARLIGGTTVVERRSGETLRLQYAAAVQSDPDALGLISWNEFSENTHVEPSQRQGTTALDVVADLEGTRFGGTGDLDSSAPARGHAGPSGLVVVIIFVSLVVAGGAVVRRMTMARDVDGFKGGPEPR